MDDEQNMMGYEPALELKMQRLFATLSEKDRRRYAGIEAAKLGHGGLEYISALFEMDPKTVRRGLLELDQTEDPTPNRVRKKRWGAHKRLGAVPAAGGQLPEAPGGVYGG